MFSIDDKKQEYLAWTKKWIPDNKIDLDLWIKKIIKNHEELHSILGDHKRTLEVNIDEVVDEEAYLNHSYPYVDAINQYLKNKIPKDYFGSSPTKKDFIKYLDNTSDSTQRLVLDYYNRVTNDKKIFIAKKSKYYATITYDPMAFIKCGHYIEADTGSCFAFGKSNTNNKYNYSVAKNTFVILVTKREPEDVSIETTATMRALGWYDSNGFYIHNIYPKFGDVLPISQKICIKKFIENLTEIPLYAHCLDRHDDSEIKKLLVSGNFYLNLCQKLILSKTKTSKASVLNIPNTLF